jgi:glycosyltransferase involved in cell wall biosynthesis
MKILFVVNGYPPTAVAGTELCARRLCAALKERGHGVSVLAREEHPGWPEYKVLRGELDGIPVVRVVNNFTRLETRGCFEHHPPIEELFARMMDAERPDLVHVQHLAGISWGIPDIVRGRGVPLVVSLHDYWYACVRVQLLRPDGTRCPGPDGGRNCARHCARGALAALGAAALERSRQLAGYTGRIPGERACLSALAFLQPILFRGRSRRLRRRLGERCQKLLGALAGADALIAPSPRAREIYASLGIPAERITVIPHGAPPAPRPPAGGGLPPYDGSRPLVIGYAGTIMPHKGVVDLLAAVRRHPPSRVRLVLHGRAYPARFERYFKKAAGRLPKGQAAVFGMYGPEQLPGILAGVDILAIPALWHETFNLVLWEAWAAGVPVLASRVGALLDSVRDGVDGLTFPPGNRRALAERIGEILARPALLGELRNNLPRFPIGIEENARRYEELYARLLAGRAAAVMSGGAR